MRGPPLPCHNGVMCPPQTTSSWTPPPTIATRRQLGRDERRRMPRSSLSRLGSGPRDALGILASQNETRDPDLVPLRTERMSASAFAFYRGTAALMAADLAAGPSSGILVPSCGDAHVANFGFYASPQRTLMFDLNDFDESAWAPWEWDLKRLITSVVIAGQDTGRDEAVVRDAALAAVRTYASGIAGAVTRSGVERYYAHFTPEDARKRLDKPSRVALDTAIRDAQKRTGERAARKITEHQGDGRMVFVENPPTMTHVSPAFAASAHELLAQYRETVSVDIALLLTHYTISDTVRRVVGVGSVGTRCFLTVSQDGDGNALLLQSKEAGQSVLIEYGGIAQPAELEQRIAEHGEGARVVAMQRILQAVSDPFLGHIRGPERDFYLRQFHDMKGSIDAETLEDGPFGRYAEACAAVLARAHAQATNAALVAGYIGNGRVVGESLLEWAYAYAKVSRADYEAFIASQSS